MSAAGVVELYQRFVRARFAFLRLRLGSPVAPELARVMEEARQRWLDAREQLQQAASSCQGG